MRVKKAYLNIENIGGENYVVHTCIDLPAGLEVDSAKLVYDSVQEKKGSMRTILCSKFLLILKTGSGSGGIVPVDSDVFKRDRNIDYIWVKVVDPQGLEDDSGGIGNYDDPD